MQSRFEAPSTVRQFVVVTLRGVIGQVVDELPVVSIGTVEIDPLPIAVHILDRGFCVAGSTEPSTNPFDIFNLITDMVEARSPDY